MAKGGWIYLKGLKRSSQKYRAFFHNFGGSHDDYKGLGKSLILEVPCDD